MLARFDYPQRNKRERGVVLAYLRRTTGYGRAQLARLVTRLADNRWSASTILAAVLPHEGMLPEPWLSLVPGYLQFQS